MFFLPVPYSITGFASKMLKGIIPYYCSKGQMLKALINQGSRFHTPGSALPPLEINSDRAASENLMVRPILQWGIMFCRQSVYILSGAKFSSAATSAVVSNLSTRAILLSLK